MPWFQPKPRLVGAFCGVDVAVDDLQVGQSPVAEQLRPSFIPMVTPDTKQRDPVIYLRILPEPPACLTAAPAL
jgi:hypothetical protein